MSQSQITTRRRNSRTTRMRASVRATAARPVLLVYRSNTHIYAQVVDSNGKVLAATSDLKLTGGKTPIETAKTVGEEIGKLAVANKVKEVSFNRRSYKYHGRVKALADGARASGLVF